MPATSRKIYLVDTCVWVNIRDIHKDSEEIWSSLILCIEVGILKTVRHVYEELDNRFPDVHARLKPHRVELLISDAETYAVEVKSELQVISADHPKLYDPLGGGNPADPWLIGVAKASGLTIVTDESGTGKGHKSKIPYVCAQRGVECIDRLMLLAALGINP